MSDHQAWRDSAAWRSPPPLHLSLALPDCPRPPPIRVLPRAHCAHLTDEQMAELNPIIRNAIYTALYALHHRESEPWCQRQFEYLLRMVPAQWEELEPSEGTREVQARERAEQEARCGWRRREGRPRERVP